MSKLKRISVAVLALSLAIPVFAARPEFIDGAYYVAFKGGASASDRALLKSHGAAIQEEFP